MRKDLTASTIILLMTGIVLAQIKTPAASPAAVIKQTIGFTDVTVEYSRPRLRERDMFADLTREGQVWRTGANMSTKLTLSTDISIEGNKVPAGAYSLYSIPGKNEWTIIINKKISWGTDYEEAEDFLRFKVPTGHNGSKVETLTFYFSDVTENTAVLGFAWENTRVEMKLETEIHEQIMAQIKELMGDPEKASINDYYTAANYYFNNDIDMDQALEWINRYVEGNNDKYWSYRLQSRILAKLGKYKDAIKAAETSLDLATKAGNQDYVYNNKKSIEEWKKNQ